MFRNCDSHYYIEYVQVISIILKEEDSSCVMCTPTRIGLFGNLIRGKARKKMEMGKIDRPELGIIRIIFYAKRKMIIYS